MVERSFDFAQDFACGFPLGINASLTPAKRLNNRSLCFARDFGSRLGRRENASALQKKSLDP